MTITLHHGDIPTELSFGDAVAVDTEAMGLNNHRDRLCLVQLSAGDGNAHLVQFEQGKYDAPNLKNLFLDQDVTKIFHYARFDISIIKKYMKIECTPLYCTKIASTLCRTYTDRHSLKELCRELLGIELSKQQQSSDWGADTLSEDQQLYAANDVLHLHALREGLDKMLAREGRAHLAQSCFEFLPVRTELDLAGWLETDIFAHS
ncbi:MAG: ribonuclease D [Rhodospirillales bacterium]|nr:ribonuclease D [Rhodospirillales bacterium]MCB9996120.1 ribonuclease D [Rhodospirillales bacterium]